MKKYSERSALYIHGEVKFGRLTWKKC